MLGSLMPVWARWAILLAACAALYGTGRIHQARDDQTEQIERDHKRMVANVDRLARRAAVAGTVGAAFETDRKTIETKTRVILKEIEHVVERPVYRDCRLDPDGLRLLNAALSGSPTPEPARVPPDPVPGALPDR